MRRTPAAFAAILAVAAPRAALAGDLGSTLVAVGVPAIVFTFVLAIVVGAFYTGYRETRERQETLRLAIEKGVPVPPELVDAASGARDPDRDLRRGIRQIFIGIGVGVLLWFVAPFRGVWAVGAMLVIFGVGHILAWALTRRTARPAAPPT